MTSTAVKNRTEQKFLPVILDSLRVDTILEFDLFIKVNSELVLYRSAHLPFTERTRHKLLENRVDRLYVTFENKSKYQRYIEANLDKILVDPALHEEKKRYTEEWITKHGTPEQQARQTAGVLPMEEAIEAAEISLLDRPQPQTFATIPPRKRRRANEGTTAPKIHPIPAVPPNIPTRKRPPTAARAKGARIHPAAEPMRFAA